MDATKTESQTIFTVGHSTLTWETFVAMLKSNGIQTLVDVRSFPGSRRYPHVGREAMERALPNSGIDYKWMPALGGRRKPKPDSKHSEWRNAAFRGYADYMDGPEFSNALEELKELAREKPTAYMCSEAVWWRCHRGLISDRLKSEGWTVIHITTSGRKEHPFTPVARELFARPKLQI